MFKSFLCGEDYAKLLLCLTDEETYVSTPKQERAAKSVETIREITHRLHEMCGLPLTLQEVHVEEKDFERVAQAAINDGAMIVNPKKADTTDVISILKRAW